MIKMGNKLDNIKNLDQYTQIAVLHHHLVPISRPDYCIKNWLETLFGEKLIENTLELKDAKQFKQWLVERNIPVVLHGHKHIPFYTKETGITIIGCGSSTGHIAHKDRDHSYISFNLIKKTGTEVSVTFLLEERNSTEPTQHIFSVKTM